MPKRTVVDSRDREILLALVLKRERIWVRAHPDTKLTATQALRFRTLMTQRRRGIPLHYLTGQREFYGREFFVGPGVLIPRPETEHLIEIALARINKNQHLTVADIGTGSGCIAVTLAAERPRLKLLAIDKSKKALRFARQNAKRHRVSRRIKFLQGNLLLPLKQSPDMIVANLPYLKPSEIALAKYEPRLALVGGKDGMAAFKNFFSQLKKFNRLPIIILEIDPRRANITLRLTKKSLPATKISLHRDLAGRARVVLIEPTT